MSEMKLIQPMNNCAFLIEPEGDCHCFSYCHEVAAIIDGKYVEFDGPQYYSRTLNKHKTMFRNHFGID